MEGEDPVENGARSAKPQPGRNWGCTVAPVAALVGIVLALRWSAAVGIPVVVVAAVLGWRSAKRSSAIAEGERAHRLEVHGPLVGDVWRRLFAADGIGDVVDKVAPHVRTAVRVATTPAEGLPLGASRVGGIPDLAPGMVWPRHKGAPLAFLAQFDLRAVAQVAPLSPLPRTGHLWFFYDARDYAGTGGPSNGSDVSVLHDPGDAPLVKTDPPVDLSKKSRFPSCAVILEAYEDIPDLSNERWLDTLLDEDGPRSEAYLEIQSELESGAHRDTHKLLGYAGPVQDVMELECHLASKGIPYPLRKKEADRVEALEAAARDWRLLFQVESDGNAKMMWGDAGRLYFWIRDEDLRAARFERTWVVFQCH